MSGDNYRFDEEAQSPEVQERWVEEAKLRNLYRNDRDRYVMAHDQLMIRLSIKYNYSHLLWSRSECDKIVQKYGQLSIIECINYLESTCASTVTPRSTSTVTTSKIYPIFLCPISGQIMNDPVTVSNGITYDRSSITEHLKTSHICPKTGDTITDVLIPNKALKVLIQRLL